MKVHLFTIFLFCASVFVNAQIFSRRADVPVSRTDGTPLAYPWTGGLNNPQFSTADFNHDGRDDLFIFDRGGDKPIILLNNGVIGAVSYSHDPTFEQNIPAAEHWALCVDATCDGVADLFTSDGGNSLRFYRGSYDGNNRLQFEEVEVPLLPDGDAITVEIYDIPAISDINGDGDVDILSFNNSGSYVEYFENQQVETGAPCSELSFAQLSECWGEFFKSGLTNELDLQVACTGLAAEDGDVQRLHPGSTILAMDIDNDGDKDAIIGDIAYENLVLASNGGNSTYAVVTETDYNFPANDQPVDVYIFPAAYHVDVNNDGEKDLLVSPNARVQSEHYRCVWYYRNNGNNDFDFQTDTLFIDQTIDVSRDAKPTFFDYNNDDLLDLVVGNYGYMIEEGITFRSALALYENTGTATEPAFKLISRDWAQANEQFLLNRVELVPTFGDLNGDGNEDMMLGDSDGFLHYFINEPNDDGTANMVLEEEQFQNIDLQGSGFLVPQLVDVNEDGLLDLLMGLKAGIVEYWRNTGTANHPVFTEMNDFFGQVDVRAVGSITGYAAPQLVKWTDGKFRLLVGSESGRLYLYNNIENNLLPGTAFTVVTNNLDNIDNGANAKPTVADLNGNGRLDMVIGLYNGGLVWYDQLDEVSIAPVETSLAAVEVFPNPVENTLTIRSDERMERLSLYNVLGQEVVQQTVANLTTSVSVAQLPKGIYLLRVQTAKGWMMEKVVVR